jgi:hypothetical protein
MGRKIIVCDVLGHRSPRWVSGKLSCKNSLTRIVKESKVGNIVRRSPAIEVLKIERERLLAD